MCVTTHDHCCSEALVTVYTHKHHGTFHTHNIFTVTLIFTFTCRTSEHTHRHIHIHIDTHKQHQDCSVGTTPGQHYARAMGAQRAQEAVSLV